MINLIRSLIQMQLSLSLETSAAQRDCRKTPGSKNVHKNLPHQAKKLPKCCAEHQKPDAFQRFCPPFRQFQRLASAAWWENQPTKRNKAPRREGGSSVARTTKSACTLC